MLRNNKLLFDYFSINFSTTFLELQEVALPQWRKNKGVGEDKKKKEKKISMSFTIYCDFPGGSQWLSWENGDSREIFACAGEMSGYDVVRIH